MKVRAHFARAILVSGTIGLMSGLLTGCGGSKSSSATPDTSSVSPTTTSTPTTLALPPDLAEVKTFGTQTQNHVLGTVKYGQSPPIGGDHSAKWQACGVYDKPVANENAVHSMEHGAVWIAYRVDLDPDRVAKLTKYAVGQKHVLVTPYLGLQSHFVLSAWSTQLVLEDEDDPRIASFIKYFQNGPQTPELGSPCFEGGIGTPLPNP
jgi:hypothetical protein